MVVEVMEPTISQEDMSHGNIYHPANCNITIPTLKSPVPLLRYCGEMEWRCFLLRSLGEPCYSGPCPI